MELLYHLPISIWAARGLLKGILLLSLKLMLVHRTWYYVYPCILVYPVESTPQHLHLHHILYPLYPLHIYIKCNIWKSDYIPLFSPNRGEWHHKKWKRRNTQLTQSPIHLDHPLVPVHLLVFGIQAFITTLTSLVVVWSWTDRSVAEKQQLTMLYAPYMALGMYSSSLSDRTSQLAFQGPGDANVLLTYYRRVHGSRHGIPSTRQTNAENQARINSIYPRGLTYLYKYL
jgi:hypothetical protein